MNDGTITIALELRVLEGSLTGRATDGDGTVREFSGWLGLVVALDALVPATAPTGSAAADSRRRPTRGRLEERT